MLINWWLCFCYLRSKLTEYYAKASTSATSKHGTGVASCAVFGFANKHGLNFNDAILVFEAPMIIAEDIRNFYGETRISGIGIIINIFVVVIFTENEEKDIRRIISFLKSD